MIAPVGNPAKEISVSKTATVTFRIKNWDEQPVQEGDNGMKLTRVSVINSYEGDIQAEGKLEMIMAHRPDGTAVYTGFEYIAGSIHRRTRTFVFRNDGSFEGVSPRVPGGSYPEPGPESLPDFAARFSSKAVMLRATRPN